MGILSFVILDRLCRRGLCRLSSIGMNQLITDGATRNSTSPGLLSSDSVGAVLILPQLENILQHAVEDLQQCSTLSSHGVSATRGSADIGGSVLGRFEETTAALRQLLALVRYSRHVRHAITTVSDGSDAASKADYVASVQVDRLLLCRAWCESVSYIYIYLSLFRQ